MARALHVFDSTTSPSALAVLDLLRHRRADDILARVGPAGTRPDLPDPDEVVRRPCHWPLAAAAGIRQLAERCRAEVIHCWSADLSDAAAAGGAATLISLYHVPDQDGLRSLRSAVGDGARIIAPSEVLAEWLTRHGVPDEAVHVVVPAGQTAPTESADPRGRVPQDRWVLLAPMTHSEDRGPYWALWAVGILKMMDEEFYLVAPGTGPALERARHLACEVGLRDRSLFPGLPGEAAAAFPWPAADAVVLFEQDGSGLPAAAGAVAAGVPVIAADTGELAAMFRHERTALLVKPRTPRLLCSALWRLRRDAELADSLAVNATADLPQLTDAAGMTAKFEQLYREVALPA